MVESDQSVAITLPENLRGQFDRLEKRLFRVETGALVAGCVAGAAGSYLLVFASDRLWDTPNWVRGIAFAGGALTIGWYASGWLKRWVIRKRNQKDLAAIVQRRFQRLGDRLLGIVELSSEQKHLHGFSPELYRAAIRQVADEAGQYDFTEAVGRNGFRRASRIAAFAGGAAVLSLFIFPQAGINALARLAAPWADVQRCTLVQLAGIPPEMLVPHGEPFSVSAQVQYRSFWKPSRVAAWFGRLHAGEGKVQAGNFQLELPGKLEEGKLRLKVGDAEANVLVRPLLRPSLKNLDANIELPAYLKLPPRDQNAQSGSLTVVEGSKASFHGQVSRPLSEARALASDGEVLATKTAADTFTTAPTAVDNLNFAEFRWKDQFGFTNQAPWKLAIQTQKDSAPVPEFPDLSREISIIESEVLQIKVRARDDFGVQKLGLLWDTGLGATNQAYDFSAEAEKPDQADFESSFTFTPLLLQVEPDSTIALKGFATDFFPGREPAETPAYRIHVLGTEQHAEMVRQRLEAIMARLEEVTRLEEKIAQSTLELKADEKLSAEEMARKADDLKDEQLQNAAALKDMAEEGMKNLREALKNPSFSEDVLKDWTKTLKEMENVAGKPMPKAAKSLEKAGKTPSQKEQNLADANETQKDILQQLQEMQKRINKGLDDLQALTLAQRLRKVGSNEKEIHADLEKTVGETIGMLPEELLPRQQKQNRFLAEQQMDHRDKSKDLQGEISRFFERTRKPNYGQVSKEMAEMRTPEELDRVRTLIEANISMQALDTLALWAGRFDAWADLLDPPKQDTPSSNGPPGEQNPEDNTLKQLMALLRLREGQLNLRERTRLLEKDHRDESYYKESATKLTEGESRLIENMEVVQLENAEAEMEPVLRDASRAMKMVESLLSKPQTDEVTAQAHNSSLEKLSDAINMLNEKAQKAASSSGQPGDSQGEEMAFLMKMMQQQNQPGMQGGFKPGMNMNGGETSMAATPVTGNAAGKGDAPRSGRKAGGTTANLPTEFRDALENYYKALEKGGQ